MNTSRNRRAVRQGGTRGERSFGSPTRWAEQEPVRAGVVEAFGADEEQLADPEQRVGLAAPMSQGLVLDSAPRGVDGTVPDSYDMERVGDSAGMS